ncbi:nhaD [Symbiodinium sp. CCMP2592]|nr:nhaD [Symbiodinium sp. CCMP2592]
MSYMLWRVLWLRAAPLFNPHALVLLAAVLAASCLHMVFEQLRLPLDPWRVAMKHLYGSLHPFHPKQAMCMDHEGTHVHLAPLRLHGTRRLNGPLCTTLMHIGGCIILVLMWLPLGAGYMLGICFSVLVEGLSDLVSVSYHTQRIMGPSN